jgi:hypothetical protein
VAHGARRRQACEVLGISARMVERWQRRPGVGRDEDLRRGPKTVPRNKLSPVERSRMLAMVNSQRFRDRSPNQIVPLLADEGRYLGSESTLYRIMREEALLAHRGRAKAPERRGPNAHTATEANQVWSWDISVPQQAA